MDRPTSSVSLVGPGGAFVRVGYVAAGEAIPEGQTKMNEWRAALRAVGLRLAIGMVALLLTIAFFALQGVDAVDHRYWLLYVVFLGSFQIFWTPVIFGFGPPLFRRFASVVIAISMMWIAMYTFFGIRDLD